MELPLDPVDGAGAVLELLEALGAASADAAAGAVLALGLAGAESPATVGATPVAAASPAADAPPSFLLLAPLYKSPYQPLPFKMKLACLICREASSFPQLGQSLVASSVIRWTRSNVCPQALH